jgi:hypothetical protein
MPCFLFRPGRDLFRGINQDYTGNENKSGPLLHTKRSQNQLQLQRGQQNSTEEQIKTAR